MPLPVFTDHFNNVLYMRPGQGSGGQGGREGERQKERKGGKEESKKQPETKDWFVSEEPNK